MWNEDPATNDVGSGAAAGAMAQAPAASLAALRDLQREVGALLKFRDLVVDALPGLRERLLTDKLDMPQVAEWAPGVRVRKKLTGNTKEKRQSGCSDAIQDSGFGTEASSKETHSSGNTQNQNIDSNSSSGDELYSLLGTIQRRGLALRDEVDTLLIRQRRHSADFQRALFGTEDEEIRRARQERDLLLDRLAESEADALAGRLHAARLQDDLEQLLGAKRDLERQLRAVVSQRGEVNSRIHDLHSQFVAAERSEDRKLRRDSRRRSRSAGVLDNVLNAGGEVPKVRSPDSVKIGAILREGDALVLQKHLLTATVQNQVLKEHLEKANEVEMGLRDKINKYREENDDLRFQLEDKSIELEGTRARVRLLEDLHQKPKNSSPDIIPNVDSSTPERDLSRTEISTASMKNMTPLPMLEPSSSTESAHQERRGSSAPNTERPRRPPSRIPLKSYTAPRPPSSCTGPRSRSGGGSPHRSHSRTRSSAEGAARAGAGAETPVAAAARKPAAPAQPKDDKACPASTHPRRRCPYPWARSWCSEYPDSLDRTYFDSIDSGSGRGGEAPADCDSLELEGPFSGLSSAGPVA